MSDRARALTKDYMKKVRERHAGEEEFLQAVEEVVNDVITVEKASSEFTRARVLDRLIEADRVISFRVVWQNDAGGIEVNRGYRVQHSNAIGPYKGGLRFHPTVSRSVLKFLAFEQTFKNAMTGLPLGGGKGGADFDPKERSEDEIMRFCHAFMSELFHHIGPRKDVPAGDIGVGAREIGHLYAAYKKMGGQFDGAITGKSLCIGGSEMRTEATGYGLIYFLCAMLEEAGEEIREKRIAVSGMGNVALYAAEKGIRSGAKVVCVSNSRGVLAAEDGMTEEALQWIRQRLGERSPIENPPARFGLDYRAGNAAWDMECDIALPCATQNEMNESQAKRLIENGCRYIAEGANMPLDAGAQKLVRQKGIKFAPGKVANAGGVAVSGIEMRQNATFNPMTREEVDEELRGIMKRAHDKIVEEAQRGTAHKKGEIDYRRGANIAAYRRMAHAIIDHGII